MSAPQTSCSYDHYALSAAEDPFPEINALRDECPVAHTEAHGGIWVLSKYTDVCAAAMDASRFSSEANGVSIPSHGMPMRVPPIEIDPPLHKTYRQPLVRWFTQASVDSREADIRGIATDLIDAFIEDGQADFAQQLTIPFPARFAIPLLGLPLEDADQLVDWAQRILSATNDEAVALESAAYFNELFERVREHPREDIPTDISRIEVDGRPINNVEFIATMATLYAAGLDTTANAGAHALELIARRDDLREQLLSDFSLIPQAVEELLRYITPLPALHRTTTEDVTVRGMTIPAGERVQLNFIGANRDPEQFSAPDEFVLGREGARKQVAFGHGVHKCLGQHLAREELRVLLEEVLTRMPDFRLSADKPIGRFSAITRGINALPVEFTPGRRSAR